MGLISEGGALAWCQVQCQTVSFAPPSSSPGSVGLPMEWPQEDPPASTQWPSAEVLGRVMWLGMRGLRRTA